MHVRRVRAHTHTHTHTHTCRLCGANRVILEPKTHSYKFRGIINGNCLGHASHIYLLMAGALVARFWWLHSARATPTDANSRATFCSFFRDSAISGSSLDRDRNRGIGGNSRETRRRRKHGIGVRAEVTPAPRRSRGRAPVRSDAFLSRSPLFGSTMSPLRHLLDSFLPCLR